MGTVQLQVEVEDLSDILDLAGLAFEERLSGTGSADEGRLRAAIDDLRSQVRQIA